MRLAEPAWLALMVLAFLPWAWGRRRPRVAWPTLEGFGRGGSLRASFLRAFPWALKGAAIACLAVAMARPQSPGGRVRVAGRGVAIVALIDRSSSMKAVDFPSADGPISRLEAAKATLSRFIQGREDDLVGLVKFANYPDLDSPPTLIQSFLLDASPLDQAGRAGRRRDEPGRRDRLRPGGDPGRADPPQGLDPPDRRAERAERPQASRPGRRRDLGEGVGGDAPHDRDRPPFRGERRGGREGPPRPRERGA